MYLKKIDGSLIVFSSHAQNYTFEGQSISDVVSSSLNRTLSNLVRHNYMHVNTIIYNVSLTTNYLTRSYHFIPTDLAELTRTQQCCHLKNTSALYS